MKLEIISKVLIALILLPLLFSTLLSVEKPDQLPKLGKPLSESQINAFARMALTNINREFPNKPSNVMQTEKDARLPSEMHPVFYGCFDWHSAVHGHWMLLRLLKLYPELEISHEIRKKLNTQFTSEKLNQEALYFQLKHNKSFERMYGWAWYLRLVTELIAWEDRDGEVWRENLKHLEKIIVNRIKEYLPKLNYPIRLGIHPDTAWGLGQTLDYARVAKDIDLEQLVIKRAESYYKDDVNYPFSYEPSGEDFFSGGLNEADVMRRILPKEEFVKWFDKFCPSINSPSKFKKIISPIPVSDPTDGKLVHLAGLDLSRAWTLQSIASVYNTNDPRKATLIEAAEAHAEVGYEYVFSGFYEGDHWLATFAIFLHTRAGI